MGRRGRGTGIRSRCPWGPDGLCLEFPALFWAILPKWGKYGNAAVIHDWLYWEQGRPRPAADAILLEGMTVLFGVSS